MEDVEGAVSAPRLVHAGGADNLPVVAGVARAVLAEGRDLLLAGEGGPAKRGRGANINLEF